MHRPATARHAAQLRAQWADPGSDRFYAINGDDAKRGLGPLLGRYRDDRYDGDVRDELNEIGHPWALSTCAFAELYYRVAADVTRDAAPRGDALAAPFFAQAGVAPEMAPEAAVAALRDAGDRMLRAVVFHSDDLELGEQFDAVTGYVKSVRNLTWSYSSFLSAVRARDTVAGGGPGGP